MEERETEAGRPEETAEPPAGGRPGAEGPRHPAPGVKVEDEPDAENIMPAEDRPGTF